MPGEHLKNWATTLFYFLYVYSSSLILCHIIQHSLTQAVEDASLNEGRINHLYVGTLPEVLRKWRKKSRPE
jgi:hypothetical protein